MRSLACALLAALVLAAFLRRRHAIEATRDRGAADDVVLPTDPYVVVLYQRERVPG